MNSVLWLRVVGTFLLGIMSTVSAMKNVSYVFVGLPQEMQKKEKKDLSAYPKKNVLTGLHADKFKGKLFDIAVDLFKELTDAEGLPERPYETTQLTLEELDILAAFLQGVYSKLTLHGGFPGVSPVVSAGFGDKKIKDILNRLGDFSDKVVDKDSASFGALDADDAAVVFVLTSVYLVSVHKSDENIVGGFAELNALSPSFAKKALAHFKERFKEKPETLAELNKVVFGPIDKQLSGAIRSIGDVKSAQMWVDVFNKNKGSLTEIQKEDLAKSFLDAVVVFIFAGYDDEEQEDAPVARKTPQEIELQLKQIRATLETLTPQKSTYEPFCSLKEQLKELGESIMQSMNHSVKKGAKESAQKTLALLKKEQLALLPLWDRLHMKFYHYVWESLDFQTLRALNEKFNSVKKFGAEPAYLGLISALRQGIPAKKVLELLKVMTEVGIVLSIQEELLDLLRKALTYTVTRVDERTPVLKAILENFFDAKPEIVQAISEMFSSEDREKDVRLAKLFDILTAHVKSHEKPQSKIGSALKTLCPNCLIPNP